MNDTAGDSAGLMVLHLWLETGDRLRVRITRTVDLRADDTMTSYAASKGEVLDVVGTWLDSFVTPR